jgi:hypothetical protein
MSDTTAKINYSVVIFTERRFQAYLHFAAIRTCSDDLL